MKQSLIAAYFGLFITFAMTFIAGREIPLPEKSAEISVPDKVSQQQSLSPLSASPDKPKPSVLPATAPAPEQIELIHGDELHVLALEDYILGVLAAEMPADFEAEALKAQAVAARSYTLYCQNSGKHSDGRVCSDFACCQAWKDEEQMRRDWASEFERFHGKLLSAVEETAGQYLSYGGEPVFSAFHSSSAGKTENCGAIWSELPYLVSVESPENEQTVPGYKSTVELSPLDFRDTLLSVSPEADFSGEESGWIEEIFLEDSGRTASVRLGGVLFPATKLRELFSLRSTAFSLEYTGESFLFSVTGFGHGVGMSQYGANVMASQGSDYSAILAHYYPGTVLVS